MGAGTWTIFFSRCRLRKSLIVRWSGVGCPVTAMKSARSAQAASILRELAIPRLYAYKSSAVIIAGWSGG